MKCFTVWGLVLALSLGPLSTHAQSSAFPNKPVRIIVPFPAGGSADALARVVGQDLSKRWSQPVLIENKPGGGTVIAGAMAAKSPPDGHTLLLIANSLTINAKLRTNLPYDGLRAFEPVAQLVHSPQVIAVNSAFDGTRSSRGRYSRTYQASSSVTSSGSSKSIRCAFLTCCSGTTR